ncbi:MAG TPA: hypothetical protein VF718_11560 [Allosphingosinicella sp.]
MSDLSTSRRSVLGGLLAIPSAAAASSTAAEAAPSDPDVPITPYDFGAVGYRPDAPYNPSRARPTAGIPDDGAALQRWADAASAPASAGKIFDATGFFGTSRPITLGPAAPYTAPRSLGGNLQLVSLAPMAKLLTLRNVDCWSWNGSIQLIGGGSGHPYASRDVQVGLAFEGRYTRFSISGSVQCYGFQLAGVPIITNEPSEFGEWLTIAGGLFGWDIGSAPLAKLPGMALTGRYSDRTDTGSAGSLGQRTTLRMATMPPAFLDDYGSVQDQVVAVRIGERPYRVTAIDRARGTITVYPWVEKAASASGTLDYIFGGLFMEGGPDGSLANIPLLASSRCVGWNCMSPYPSNIGWMTSQFDGCAMLFGAPSTAQFGGRLGGFYSEQGGSTYEMVMFNGDNNRLSFGNLAMADLARWHTPYAWDGVHDVAEPGLMWATVENRQWEKNPNGKGINGLYGGETIAIEANKPTAVFDPVDNFVVRIAPFDPGQDRLFGVRSRRVIVSGSGDNGEPTGTVTVEAPPRRTVNGSASIRYADLRTPLHLVVTADPATGNFTCKRLGTVPAEPMADVRGAPTQADFNALLAKLRANGTLAP